MVGEVTRTLEEEGLAENTLVIFTSDNSGMINMGGQLGDKGTSKTANCWALNSTLGKADTACPSSPAGRARFPLEQFLTSAIHVDLQLQWL